MDSLTLTRRARVVALSLAAILAASLMLSVLSIGGGRGTLAWERAAQGNIGEANQVYWNS